MHTNLVLSRKSGVLGPRSGQGGFSLVELMIASTLGLLILSTMITVFVSTSQTRNEVDKSSRQIENGRFAIEMLREDIQLAAFYGDYLPTSTISWTTPNPCSLKLNRMGFATGYVPVGIYGFPSATTSSTNNTYVWGASTDTETATLGCLSNRKADTGILVIRRVSTAMVRIDVDENGTQDANFTKESGATVAPSTVEGAYYFQASNCSDTPTEASYVMAKTAASYTLHGVKPAGIPTNCMNGGLSPIRQYFVRIFYIATCNNCSGGGDGIPTLKMVELTPGTAACAADPAADCGSMTTLSMAEGIENVQFEYGVDSDADGAPNSYSAAPAAADWPNALAVKIFLLARNTEITGDYKDTKTYSLASDGTTLAGTPFNDQYKRHVYAATVRAINIGNRR